MSAPAPLEAAAQAADYAAFLRALDAIPAGSYFTVENLRAELDPLDLPSQSVGAFMQAAYRAGYVIATDRTHNCQKASRRGGTARVWRKAGA